MIEYQGLDLWNQVCDTDQTFTTKVNTRGGFTAIDATYQKRRATAMWGPYGTTWGLRNLRWGYVGAIEGLPSEMWLEATFYWPGGEFEISSDEGWARGQDTRKKLQTDALKKALSYLGFSADVYLGRFDDEKYVEHPTESSRETADKAIAAILAAEELELAERYLEVAKHRNLTKYHFGLVQDTFNKRRMELEHKQVF